MRNARLLPDVPDAVETLDALCGRIWQRAPTVDTAAVFPAKDIADIAATGLLHQCPALTGASALPVLAAIGGASLTVGRCSRVISTPST